MSEIVIRKHNFEEAKSHIEKFSKELPSNPSFSPVQVDGWFLGLGDHKVTGTEMNTFIKAVQDKLILVNTSLMGLTNEYKEVYNALDALDKDYIGGIIGAVESAQDASDQALKTQRDIKTIVDNLKVAVEKLSKLKITTETLENDINIKYAKITSLLNEQRERNEELNNIFSNLSSKRHFEDIDTIWNDVEEHKNDLKGLHQQVYSLGENIKQTTAEINNNIAALQDYRSVLESYKHLGEIDALWNVVEGHKTNLDGLHQQVDNFEAEVHQTEKDITETIQKKDKSNEKIRKLQEKKIKIAYAIGGTAVGMSIIQLILQLIGIL